MSFIILRRWNNRSKENIEFAVKLKRGCYCSPSTTGSLTLNNDEHMDRKQRKYSLEDPLELSRKRDKKYASPDMSVGGGASQTQIGQMINALPSGVVEHLISPEEAEKLGVETLIRKNKVK